MQMIYAMIYAMLMQMIDAMINAGTHTNQTFQAQQNNLNIIM